MTLLRYGGVSVVALSADVGSLALFKAFHLGDLLAVAIAYLFGALVSYLGAIHFVFSQRPHAQRRWFEAGLYLLFGLAGLAVTELVVAIGGLFTVPLPLSKAAAIVASFFLCYLLRKHLLFVAPRASR